MWLLPVLSRLSSLAVRTFYRLEAAGGRVPLHGPVLLVANHPNSLMDPALVAAVARRPVRFLAKAPLFGDRQVGWMVRGAGAIPVYRASDDPAEMGANEDSFRAAHGALAEGAAVGIFPEGLSHSEPSLAPLRTGAARIALGAAGRLGRAFPIVPVGLVFRGKERFRSDALAVIGEPVEWDDLCDRGTGDVDAVRELTRRIDRRLREVTVNLERWEDAPLVETAEEIYAAEWEMDADPADRVERLREATEGLARLRGENLGEWREIAREVSRHGRLLDAVGLRPADLREVPRLHAAVRWTVRQLAFFLVATPLAVAGTAVYFLPYRLTGILEARARPSHDVRATYKLLVGAVVHLVWTVGLALATGALLGGWAGVAVLAVLPLLGLLAVAVHNRWEEAVDDARRFLLLRGRGGDLLPELRLRQRRIAERLEALREELAWVSGGSSGGGGYPPPPPE
ncbi:MAG TPA: lysophospholipid acyltransferase family protein [Longimicrobiaceae bacterium]|nr:lysophospholipid acyltransferase family protein [Longimicrobiaceae bacterium]